MGQRISKWSVKNPDGIPMAFPPETTFSDIQEIAVKLGMGTRVYEQRTLADRQVLYHIGTVASNGYNETGL